MANILDIVKEIEKPLLSPQESFFIGSPSYKEAAKETKKAKIETMEKSILDVFGEKSKDSDELWQSLRKFRSQWHEGRRIREPDKHMSAFMDATDRDALLAILGTTIDESLSEQYPTGGTSRGGYERLGEEKNIMDILSVVGGLNQPSRYKKGGKVKRGVLDEDAIELLKSIFGTKQFEGSPYDFLEEMGILKPNKKQAVDTKFIPQRIADDVATSLLDILSSYDPHGYGYSGNPYLAHEALIEEDIAGEGFPSKASLPPEMQQMGKGEAILAKLASLLGRGK